MEKLVNGILQGNKRSVAKAISIIEGNNLDKKNQLTHLLYPHTGKSKVIGITGPPGAGKSTLVDGLIEIIRQQNLTVGVIAVDPSSPYTGGALLGDRVRMQRHSTDPGVFIRSMGSRGMLGGLSRATKEAIRILDAMGLDIILIETVGVGQSELDVINIADTTAVVLHPSTGDSIQAFKAGIMEIADIFVINKSDLPGCQKMLSEIELLLDLTQKQNEFRPPIVKTIGTEKIGIELLWNKMNEHFIYATKTGIIETKRALNIEKEIFEIIHDFCGQKIENLFKMNGKQYKDLITEKEKSPVQIAKIISLEMFND